MPSPRLPLSLALIGITSAEIGDEPRGQIAWAGSTGYRAAQINAAAPGVRPRELDRSGRRDLAALLRRHGLVSSGVDLFIPEGHLTDPAHADRAMSALLGATELAADLADLTGGAPVLSTVLARGEAAETPVHSLAEAALARGVRIADHAWPPAPERGAGSPIGVGVDPAAVFLAAGGEGGVRGDPGAAVSSLKERLASVRLSDIAPGGRVAPGDGRLDELSYGVAIATSAYRGHLVVDLRGLRRQAEVARAVLERLGSDAAGSGRAAYS